MNDDSSTAVQSDGNSRSQRPVWLGKDHRGWDHARMHRQLLEDPRLGAYEHSVYFGLAVHAEVHSGRCFPAVPALAHYSLVSDRTVQRALRVLDQAGYIAIETQPGRASTYHLLPPPPLDRGDSQSPVGGDRDAGGVVTLSHQGGDSGADEQEPVTRTREQESSAKADDDTRPEIQALCDELAARIATHRDDDEPPAVTKGWLKDMRLLVERGPSGQAKPTPLSVERVHNAITFVFERLTDAGGNGFCWADQVQSPRALRRHFAQIRLAHKRLHENGNGYHEAVLTRESFPPGGAG